MKDIIKREFEQRFGKRPAYKDVGKRSAWTRLQSGFEAGWLACEEFMLEQKARGKDRQDEINISP